MIVIPVKDGENIERALKRFKRKVEKTGVVKQLRGRQAFEKPSITRRTEIKKAIYIENLQRSEE
jgi:small subunit ribosomal protein S21